MVHRLDGSILLSEHSLVKTKSPLCADKWYSICLNGILSVLTLSISRATLDVDVTVIDTLRVTIEGGDLSTTV